MKVPDRWVSLSRAIDQFCVRAEPPPWATTNSTLASTPHIDSSGLHRTCRRQLTDGATAANPARFPPRQLCPCQGMLGR